MSGGSFNYLFLSDTVGEAASKHEDLREMARTLQEVAPDHPVTHYTMGLTEMLGKSLPAEVSDVWHAVEWWRSADSGVERVEQTLEKTKDFRGEKEW